MKKQKEEKYPEGHFVGVYMGIFMAVFTGAWIPISIATGNPGLIGIGPALGVAVGVAVGQGVENKYREEGRIRPLTEKEKKNKKMMVIIGIIIFLLGLVALVSFWVMKIK